METYIVTGERLKALRGDVLNQKSIAQAIGLSQTTYSDWESNPPRSLEHLRRLAAHFNVSADYLLGITDDPTPASDRRAWSEIVIGVANDLMELPAHRQQEMARAVAGMVARHHAETNLDVLHQMTVALVGAEAADVLFRRLDNGDSADVLLGLFKAALNQQREKLSDALSKDDLAVNG